MLQPFLKHKPQTFSRVCLRLKRRVSNSNGVFAVGNVSVIEVQTRSFITSEKMFVVCA